MAKAICLYCEKDYFCRPQNSGGKYCSNWCQKNYENEQRYLKWLNGENGIWSNTKSLKKAVIMLNGYTCKECNLSEWNNKPLVLDLEHIDGNSSNDIFTNLCLLCPNCHSQTSTYKNKNKGNGRAFRRKNSP